MSYMLLLFKGHLWDSLDIIWEIFRDTSRQIFTLSLINDIVCIVGIRLCSHLTSGISIHPRRSWSKGSKKFGL